MSSRKGGWRKAGLGPPLQTKKRRPYGKGGAIGSGLINGLRVNHILFNRFHI